MTMYYIRALVYNAFSKLHLKKSDTTKLEEPRMRRKTESPESNIKTFQNEKR